MRIMLAVMVLSGCSSIFGPEIVVWGQRPMTPVPAVYAEWYADVEACWGRQGHLADVRWFVADKITLDVTGRALGTTNGDDITIKDTRTLVEGTVKHEMSHHVSGLGDAIHFDDGTRALCDDAE